MGRGFFSAESLLKLLKRKARLSRSFVEAPVFFFHFHKVAGTSVVSAAERGGHRVAYRDRNGNVFDCRTGHDLLYSGRKREDIKNILKYEFERGATFIAAEWDFPPIDVIREIPSVSIITVLRDPTARALSNYRYEAIYGRPTTNTNSFTDYWDRNQLFRSDNYYTRMLNNLSCEDVIEPNHVASAIFQLQQLDAVAILEKNNLSTVFGKFGIGEVGRENVSAPTEDLKKMAFMTDVERDQFYLNNFADYCVYEYFKRVAIV